MMIEDDTGFVLHARAYRETSLLVEVLSAQHGRIGLLARGVSTAKRMALRMRGSLNSSRSTCTRATPVCAVVVS